MPNRVLRPGLLESDRFLGLPDNTHRLCFIVVLLRADDFGNLEGSPGQLVRLWRDFGIDSIKKAATVCGMLVDHDLVRGYEVDGKAYLHVPRFGQRIRHVTRSCPRSPWTETQQKQTADSENDGRSPDARLANDGRTSAEVKRSEEKRSKPTTADSQNSSAMREQSFPKRGTYPEDFERCWRIYPKRAGDNPKARAYKAWCARIKQGHRLEMMISGAERYAAWVGARLQVGDCHIQNRVAEETLDRPPGSPGERRRKSSEVGIRSSPESLWRRRQ